MMRLKAWHRRWLLWVRGECPEGGCDRPKLHSPYKRCEQHEAEHWHEIGKRFEAEKFEREVSVQAEALRRVAPELPIQHPPALDPEDRERVLKIADRISAAAQRREVTPATEKAEADAELLRNLASHQGGGEELKAVRDFADERRDELNAARSTLDRSDQRYEANAGEARAFGSVVAFIDTLDRSHPEGQVER